MTNRAVHLQGADGHAVCGRASSALTGDRSGVTCKDCLERIEIVGRKARESKLLPAEQNSPRSFYTKVAGVTFANDDGSRRQKIIPRCGVGESLRLVRYPDDPFDPGAIAVLRRSGEQLGFIPAHVSRGGDPSGLAAQMDEGAAYKCRVANITGGGPGLSFGINIEITDTEFPETILDRTPVIPGPGLTAALWLILVAIIALAVVFVISQAK